MSKPKGFEKPAGVRDYLPHAVTALRRIESQVLECMESWGYQQIITPTMEYYDTVGVASSTSDQKLFKLLNNRGTSMVLRSDMTAPIARLAASLLKDEPLPMRLSYHANVFRAIEEEAGRETEFFQTGVELIGDDTPEADAEVVALAIESLRAAGVTTFKIALGHVGFLDGLLREVLTGRPADQERLKLDLLNRDYVGFRSTIGSLGLPQAAAAELEGILSLRGGREVCGQAMKLCGNVAARTAIEHLNKVWDVLDDYGSAKHVLIDLTMIGDFSYYTGMTFEGYASDIGFPVVSGGRYDNLLEQLGRRAPATGFALKTNRVLDGIRQPVPEGPQTVLIQYTPERRKEGLETAAMLRKQGRCVVTSRMDAPLEDRVAGGTGKGSGGLLHQGYDEIMTFA